MKRPYGMLRDPQGSEKKVYTYKMVSKVINEMNFSDQGSFSITSDLFPGVIWPKLGGNSSPVSEQDIDIMFYFRTFRPGVQEKFMKILKAVSGY